MLSKISRRSLLAAGIFGWFALATANWTRGQETADPAKEANPLTGLWRLDAFEMSGIRINSKDEPLRGSDLWASRFRFDDSKAEWLETPDAKPLSTPLKLNPRALPKAIDLEIFGVTVKGIYAIENDTIKACFSVKSVGRGFAPGSEERPSDFTTRGTLERLVLVFAKVDAKN